MVGSSSRISQSARSKAIHEVTAALVEVAPQFIRFPSAAEYPAVKQAFYALGMTRHGAGFPNVLGAIDCTHVRIQKPSTEAPEKYLNRHLYYSINVQLVVSSSLKIFNVFAAFPGSNHDSFIWRNSAVRDGIVAGNFIEGWLVGDSGYPQEPWLMTPVTVPTTVPEQLYNAVHISTRNPVERTNGVLKSRWHVLDSPLAYSPAKVCAITTACCVLHNICT
nr:PREDICTED: putative nuclease HARBI1 [Tribolium castaneum]|eukprot:XP_015840125.1 PREDICTED: putative nuclease HARBI1 [Tribolium castaneum]